MAHTIDNRYGIKCTRYWFNSGDTHEIAADPIGNLYIFDTKAEAESWIVAETSRPGELYELECALPDWRAVKVQSAWYRGELGRMRQYIPFAGADQR